MRKVPGFQSAVVMAAVLFTPCAQAQILDEYHVKAAFVFNFAKFIEWPTDSFKTPGLPLVICVLGQDQMANSLREAVNGKIIDGRPIVVHEFAIGQASYDCNILFVGSAATKRFRSSLKESAGLLTIGETPGFAADGGVISFKLEDGKIRFEINVAAAERQQLHISSKLLSLAQLVKR